MSCSALAAHEWPRSERLALGACEARARSAARVLRRASSSAGAVEQFGTSRCSVSGANAAAQSIANGAQGICGPSYSPSGVFQCCGVDSRRTATRPLLVTVVQRANS